MKQKQPENACFSRLLSVFKAVFLWRAMAQSADYRTTYKRLRDLYRI
jgi:hypothetical protein